MSKFPRGIPPGLRRQVFIRSHEHCQHCGGEIEYDTFHVAHVRAASHGGPAILENLEAWHAQCNMSNGPKDVRDTRVTLRDWQREALPEMLTKLTTGERVATLMAAPGAGKTLIAAVVFAKGQAAGFWQRVLVLVPRLPLVEQWKAKVLEQYHVALDADEAARSSGRELTNMDGVVSTYQSLLSPRALEGHRAAAAVPTLVILDEVHHLGQPVRDEAGDGDPAWSRAVKDLVGDLRTGITVAAVLNLSGTLFRTSPAERISTVKYVDALNAAGEPRIQSVADFVIDSPQLVSEELLRAPDLFRVGAQVEVVDLRTAELTSGGIADLTEDKVQRTVLRELNRHPEWLSTLVKVTLDELEARYRDSGRKPVKALIVTARQSLARQFATEVNQQMAARNLQPLAECVVSDDKDAYTTLERFRVQQRVGVLCCVGMAGEGYDAPDICVVCYATNVMTAQYIRQVVARGQRVTNWERERHRLTTAIVLPDVPELVEQFTQILAPMVPHDIAANSPPGRTPPRPPREPGDGPPCFPGGMDLSSVQDVAVDVVTVVSTGGNDDVDPVRVDELKPILRDVHLPESSAPRMLVVIEKLNQQRPFDPPVTVGSPVTFGSPVAVADRPASSRRPMTAREQHHAWRALLNRASRWWAHHVEKTGGPPVSHFWTDLRRATGIDDLGHATPEQLQHAVSLAREWIGAYCDKSGTPFPNWLADVQQGTLYDA